VTETSAASADPGPPDLRPPAPADARPPGPAAVRVFAALAHGAAGVMLDIGLMVLGSILVGLSAAVLLVGIGVVETSRELSTEGTFVSGVALAVSGLLCLGIASESPLGRGDRLAGFGLRDVGVGLAACALLIGLGAMLIYWPIAGFVEDGPWPLRRGAEAIRAVGVSGMAAMPLVGVPLSVFLTGLRDGAPWRPVGEAPGGSRRAPSVDFPALFTFWAVAAMILLALS